MLHVRAWVNNEGNNAIVWYSKPYPDKETGTRLWILGNLGWMPIGKPAGYMASHEAAVRLATVWKYEEITGHKARWLAGLECEDDN